MQMNRFGEASALASQHEHGAATQFAPLKCDYTNISLTDEAGCHAENCCTATGTRHVTKRHEL